MRVKGKENRCTKTIHHDASNNNLPSLSLGKAKVTKFQKFPHLTHTSFLAARDINLMALNLGLGLGLGSTSLILLTTSFKGTSWGSSDAARSYDAQRPVLLPAPVAWAAV